MEQQAPAADTLAAVVDGMSAALSSARPAEHPPWHFARCWVLATRYENHGRELANLDRALADFAALPPGFPGRPKLAAVLVVAQMRAGALRDSNRHGPAVVLAEIAQADPAPLPDWDKARAALRAQALMLAARDGAPGFEPRAALTELKEYADVVGDAKPYVDMIDLARTALLHLVGTGDGDFGTVAQADKVMAGFAARHQSPSSPLAGGKTDILAELMAVQQAAMRGDLAYVRAALPKLAELARSLPEGDPSRQGLERTLNTVGPLLGIVQSGPAGTGTHQDANLRIGVMPEDGLSEIRRLADMPGMSGPERALRLCNLAMSEMAVGTKESLDRAAETVDRCLDVASEQDPRWPYYLMSAGMVYGTRGEEQDRSEDLAKGIAFLEQARDAAGTAVHSLWTLCSIPLSHAYRLSGRRDLGRRTALSALRGHAWNVLLQSRTEDVHAAARHAAGDALVVARMCLSDQDAEGAAAALESGRGLILYAAAETRDLESRLIARGETRLAADWGQASATRTPDDIPLDLRRRVVAALAGVALTPDGALVGPPTEATTRLLDPPSTHEIRAALTASGMDALVYLVPGDELNGAAVIVPADAEPRWVLLPRLRAPELGDFERFLLRGARDAVPTGLSGASQGASARDAHAVLPNAPQTFDTTVGGVCDWAWEAAIGPLLNRHLDLPSGRPARIVLIPMRELTRVPWHAARRREGKRQRYALEDAVFSYAASARMFCESAWRGDVPLTDAGLVVGDPDTAGHARDLPAARAEARAVKDCFYPAARYVGRRADGQPGEDGSGGPEQIKDWLADPEGGAVMHLACHGVVRAGTGTADTSYLLLAGGRHLAAEELISALSAGPGRGVALAVLAACSSAETGRGYDEAFSLTTTLLAQGVRSVISAQWSVPDAETSVLMFMFHHYLRDKGLAPLDALRAAQLWMIGDRKPPETMPPELRRRFSARREPDIASWAAFVHTGR